jgi:hypothetical protein
MENRIGPKATHNSTTPDSAEFVTEPLPAVAVAALHRLEQAFAPSPTPDSTQAEALRRVVAEQIGPRQPGVVYYDGDRLVQVRAVVTDPSEARRILRRRSAQYAIEIIDLHTGDSRFTGAVWTGSDRVLKAVA